MLPRNQSGCEDYAFEHLCLDVFPDGEGGTQLMIYLTARFDESENVQVGKPHIYTVAGWIAEVRNWERMRADWDAAMLSYGLTRRGFHMTDFIGGYRDYSDHDEWSDEVKERRFRQLAKIIEDHRLHGFGSSVCARDFNDVITPELKKSGLKNRYYGFNIIRILEDIEEWIDAQNYSKPVSVHYVFAQGHGADADIIWLFNLLCNDPALIKRFRIGPQPWSAGDMKRDGRLQPSDILACLANRYVVRAEEGRNLDVLKYQTEHWWEVLIEQTMRKGKPSLTPILYNNVITLRRWLVRSSTVGDLFGPTAKGFKEV